MTLIEELRGLLEKVESEADVVRKMRFTRQLRDAAQRALPSLLTALEEAEKALKVAENSLIEWCEQAHSNCECPSCNRKRDAAFVVGPVLARIATLTGKENTK